MAFRCEFDRSRKLLFIFVEGTVNLREALKMIVDTVADGRFDPRYEVLADSMGAQHVGAIEGAWAIAELLEAQLFGVRDPNCHCRLRQRSLRVGKTCGSTERTRWPADGSLPDPGRSSTVVGR